MMSTKIEKLEELLQRYTGKTVKETKTTRLTGPGENFGSIMVKVDAILVGSEGAEEELHVVAKCIPEEEQFRQMFQTNISVNNEMKFYTVIVPTMQQFQKERGVTEVIDCFAKFYGGRVNLEEKGDEVDDHAMLIFENLKQSGYRNIDRFVGFNFEDAKLVLKDLAAFHAIPLAIKLQDPQLFEDNIKKYTCTTYGGTGAKMGTLLTDLVEDLLIPEPDKEKVKKLFENLREAAPVADEIFKTLSHADMWINNTMQRFEDGKAVQNKLIDFQEYRYDSLVRDLMCFLITSCETETFRKHADELIDHYYQHFVRTLSQLGCDTTPYTPDKIYEEIKKFTPRSLPGGIMFTTMVVMGRKKSNPNYTPFDPSLSKEDVPRDVKRRLACVIDYYVQKGFL